MLELSGKFIQLEGLDGSSTGTRRHFRISTDAELPLSLASESAYLCNEDTPAPDGFALYLRVGHDAANLVHSSAGRAHGILPPAANYLADGDIVRVSPQSKSYRVMFRRQSPHNSILLTERCNHYCLMCSQPPRDADDGWIMDEVEQLIPLIPDNAAEIGFTGGEPTIYGDRLVELLKLTDRLLPRTAVHLLSNGRRFADLQFAKTYADVNHHDLMVGIPLYSDDVTRHNYVVQAEGAFDETINGILNLKRLRQRVEIRVVIHAQTVDRLPKLAEFVARNLLFVDQVALMGLEISGFGRGNLKELWIDPYDYRDILEEAVNILTAYQVPVAVYNHQLCVVTPSVRRYCVRSISDWKNEYLPECATCDVRAKCGGFFSSQVRYRHSDHISPTRATKNEFSNEVVRLV